MNTYKIGYNFYIGKCPRENDIGNIILRYFQVGIADKQRRFTGIIQDYCGGGDYGYFYYIKHYNIYNGIYLQKGIEEDYEDLDNISQEMLIDKQHPKLIEQIYEFLAEYTTYNNTNGHYMINQKFYDTFDDVGKTNHVWSSGDFDAIGVGNTYFEGVS